MQSHAKSSAQKCLRDAGIAGARDRRELFAESFVSRRATPIPAARADQENLI